jgi:hypothetical protein
LGTMTFEVGSTFVVGWSSDEFGGVAVVAIVGFGLPLRKTKMSDNVYAIREYISPSRTEMGEPRRARVEEVLWSGSPDFKVDVWGCQY